MEPVVFVCGGCGARIRTVRPEVTRTRPCPRCLMPLAAALLSTPWPEAEPRPSAPAGRPSIRRALGSSLMLAALATPILFSALLAPRRTSSLARMDWATPSPQASPPRPVADPTPVASPQPSSPGRPIPRDDAGPLPPVASISPTPIGGSGSSRPSPAAPDPPAAPMPAPEPSPEATNPQEPRRVVVTDQDGRRLVCRVYAEREDTAVVLLPDGSLGLPNGLVYTDEPFRPTPIGEVSAALEQGPYRGFEVLPGRHYLVFYQGSIGFAEASARLLESLYDGLTGVLREKGVAVHEAEFPLVAVIFATEAGFRAHRAVDPDVQAYYETYSNRIFFYETSGRDQEAPEIAARRRPQTVAHEGTHQILQNIGVQPRLAPWPSWLVEGLAEYCAPTTTGRDGSWARFGAVNPFHMATLIDLEDTLALQQRNQGLTTPRIGREPGTPLVETIVTRAELTPTDYAAAWALTHYLASRRFEDFLDYLKQMARISPLEDRTPAQHLAEFRARFGADLARMDKKVGLHLAGLKGYEAIPYYAVVFEQPLGLGRFRRGTLVSRSPSVVRQWLDTITSPQGGPPWWRATSWPTRTRAFLEIEAWSQSR